MTAAAGTPMAEIEARLADNRQQLAFEPRRLWRAARRRAGSGHDRRRARLQPLRPAPDQGRRRARSFSGRPGGHRPRRADQGGRPGGQERHRLRSVQASGRQLRHARGHDRGFGQGPAGGRGDADPAACRARAARTASAPCGRRWRARTTSPVRPTCPPAAAARSTALSAAGTGVAALRLEGPGPSLRHRADALKDLLRLPGAEVDELDTQRSQAFWREVRDVAPLPAASVLWRVSAPPGAGAALLEALDAIAPAMARRLGGRPDLACARTPPRPTLPTAVRPRSAARWRRMAATRR